jgi:hypothetical protein
MKTDVTCEIKCSVCNNWFRSPIQFGDAESFFGTATWGNTAQCPNDGQMTPCNKDNMRFHYRDADGKVIYEEGKDAY